MPPLTINGSSPKTITFGGQPVKRVNYNGTQVWKAGGKIPVGGILPYTSSTPPSGWDFWNYGINRALRGAGGDTSYLGNVGTGQITLTGETNYEDDHLGTADSLFVKGDPTITTGIGSYRYHNRAAGGHLHPMEHALNYTPPSLRAPMIIKVGSPGEIPADAFVMAMQALDDNALAFVSDYVGRVLAAANSLAIAGSNPGSVSFYTDAAGGHRHSGTAVTNDGIGPTFGPDAYDEEYVPDHEHWVDATITAINLKRIQLALYQANEATLARPQTVIGYMGDGSNLGADWEILDMSDRVIELSAETDAGKTLGDDSVEWEATNVSVAGGHDGHDGDNNGQVDGYWTSHGDSVDGHPHTVPTRSGSASPEAFGVKFIRYVG